MADLKNVSIIALSASVAALSVALWKQHSRLETLQASETQWRLTERPKLETQLAKAEEALAKREQPRSRLSSLAETAPPSARALSGPTAENRPPQRGPTPFENPEVQRLMAPQQRGALDGRYAALFKTLQLGSTELDRFKQLLLDKQTVVPDVMLAARASGVSARENRAELDALIKGSREEVDAAIKELLGDARYAQYTDYETTGPQRTMARSLEQRLSYSDSPLLPAQAEQLIRILAETSQSTDGNALLATPSVSMTTSVGTIIGGPPTGSIITEQGLQRAQAILTPTQLQALRDLQSEQQSQAAAIELIRSQQPGRSPPPPPPTKSGSGG